MPKFPKDAPKAHVVSALEALGFQIVREREHIAMVRESPQDDQVFNSSSDLPSEFDLARRLSQGLRAVLSGDTFCLPATAGELPGLGTVRGMAIQKKNTAASHPFGK
jgi:hypothetical protein